MPTVVVFVLYLSVCTDERCIKHWPTFCAMCCWYAVHEKSGEWMRKVTSICLKWWHSIMPWLEGKKKREENLCARKNTYSIGCNHIKSIALSQTIYSIAFRFKLTLDLSRSAVRTHHIYHAASLCCFFASWQISSFFPFHFCAYVLAQQVLCAAAHKTCPNAIHFHFRIDFFHSSK